MTTENKEQVLDLVFQSEGGFVNHAKDPGGPTNFGVTQAKLAAWRGKPASIDDVKALSKDEARSILAKDYWTPVRADDLPAGLDLAAVDFAVNSGPAQAARTLQRLLKVEPDGVIGSKTLSMIPAYPGGIVALITALSNARLSFLKRLRIWSTFGRGWTQRVNRVRDAAIALATGTSPPSALAFTSGVQAKAPPTETRLLKTLQGRWDMVGVAGAVGAAASELGNQLQPLSDVMPKVQVAAIGLAAVGTIAGTVQTINALRQRGQSL